MLAVLALASVSPAEDRTDPWLGEALYYAHQERWFEALERLDAEIAQHYRVDERELDALHPFGATRIDEEIGWLATALSPATFEAQWHIPSFVAWSEARDPGPVYAEFARILRTDAATMGNTDRPRVLKCPQFAEDLPALLQHFPGARLVVTHRDAAAIVESSVSLVASQMAPQSTRRDLSAITAEWQRKLALRQQRIERALAGFAGQVAHVDFDRLNVDSLLAECFHLPAGLKAAFGHRDIRFPTVPSHRKLLSYNDFDARCHQSLRAGSQVYPFQIE